MRKLSVAIKKTLPSLVFLRYSDSSPTIETQICIDQNGNKIYFNDSKTPRIDPLMMFDKSAGSFFVIL